MSEARRNLITFQSKEFNTTVPQEHFINDCCYGDDICKWLIEELTKKGVDCDKEPGQEDFGWYFNFSVNKVVYCLVCAFRLGEEQDQEKDQEKEQDQEKKKEAASTEAENGDWIIWIERSAGFMASLFGARNKGLDEAVPKLIHSTLSANPAITNIKWHRKKDFDSGREDLALASPE
ncbi:MAG: hypothetical protein QG574_2628 [Cyanobacteriota bacterium erpe_2018_sw_21hr_WHONDRS-SW48-000092_B_bin.40]|jgi:hypothetical protein|nr:hypothetical protein [Cyanobacteriota bacterium erpe_2018_sw_21hr_WHONDRS-SW48-000092_B_bin.40]